MILIKIPPSLQKLGGSGAQNKGVCNLIATMQLKPATFGNFWQVTRKIFSNSTKHFSLYELISFNGYFNGMLGDILQTYRGHLGAILQISQGHGLFLIFLLFLRYSWLLLFLTE